MGESWYRALKDEFQKPYFREVSRVPSMSRVNLLTLLSVEGVLDIRTQISYCVSSESVSLHMTPRLNVTLTFPGNV